MTSTTMTQVESLQTEECFNCHVKYTPHAEFCNDCGTDYCLECLDFSNGRVLEYNDYLCYNCDAQRVEEEEAEAEAEAAANPQQG